MEPLGVDGRPSATVRLLVAAAVLIAATGVFAAATHHPRRPTSVQVASPSDARGTTTTTLSSASRSTEPTIVATDETTTSAPDTAPTDVGDATTPTAAGPDITTPSSVATTVTTKPVPPCGPPPPASSVVPPPGQALYWIQNTSPTTSAMITADFEEPHQSLPCSTIGPFAVTPQHDEPPTAGEDWVGVDEGQGCGYSNEGLLFHAGGSYRLTLIDLGGMSGWCQVPNPPATVLHVQVFDMANGQRMDDGKP